MRAMEGFKQPFSDDQCLWSNHSTTDEGDIVEGSQVTIL